MKRLTIFLTALALGFGCHADNTLPPADHREVVFVCEHGSAKSVIAAAYFNKLAGERGLALRAVSRGIQPDAELQPATQQGLRRDGMPDPQYRAAPLTEALASQALRVVTIGIESKPDYLSRAARLEWNDVPPVGKDYEAARADMVRKIETLIGELAPR
ncbi:arsenate-mycothiol transferase ArsC [Paucibacter soli]|uniref:arsenate-mycothiol transferase ArsC n=1 Tax=Paucibacter soli TaxID=3133433 RepID=UPI0030A02F0F